MNTRNPKRNTKYFVFLTKKIQENLLLGSSVQFSCSVVSDSLTPYGLQHARLPCPSSTPGACSNSCPLSRWCHPTISSVVPFSSCLQSFPESGSFPMSWFCASGGQSIGVSASASVLPIITLTILYHDTKQKIDDVLPPWFIWFLLIEVDEDRD